MIKVSLNTLVIYSIVIIIAMDSMFVITFKFTQFKIINTIFMQQLNLKFNLFRI